MSRTCSKKLIVMYIFDILRKYTDESHRLNQKQILEILEKDYQIHVDRKAVQRYISELEDCFSVDMKESDYSIMYDTITRKIAARDPITKESIVDCEMGDFWDIS